MKTTHQSIKVSSTGVRPTFHDVTEDVKKAVEQSKVKSGICVVYSHHTTCSVMIQESSFDVCYNGLEFLQQDLCEVFDNIVPPCKREGQYMHPGPKLTEYAKTEGEMPPQTLNTDAHLRSALMGRSESIVIIDGVLDLGSYAHIYFVDYDITCARNRTVQVQILGE